MDMVLGLLRQPGLHRPTAGHGDASRGVQRPQVRLRNCLADVIPGDELAVGGELDVVLRFLGGHRRFGGEGRECGQQADRGEGADHGRVLGGGADVRNAGTGRKPVLSENRPLS